MDPVLGAARAVRGFLETATPIEVVIGEVARHGAEAVGSELAGFTWRAGRACSTIGATDAVVLEIDEVQYRHVDGPCLAAATDGSVRRVDDTAERPSWPAFCDAAHRRGVRSSLSVPVLVGGRPSGALNFYGRRPHQFDDEVVDLASLFAAQAAVVAALEDAARTADQLKAAIESRSTIEQAKGVIMAATGCDADAAFRLLRDQSQNENRKLRDVAAELVARQQQSGRATP